MTKRCFLCGCKMDESTGLCTNASCVRSHPLPAPEEKTETTEETEKSGEQKDK